MNIIESNIKESGLLNEHIHKKLKLSYHTWKKFKDDPRGATLSFDKLEQLAEMFKQDPVTFIVGIFNENKR